jgi:hypothetical protein
LVCNQFSAFAFTFILTFTFTHTFTSVLQEIALNIDLAPTFVELAGAPPPSSMDGQSLGVLLQAPAPPGSWRTDFLVEHSGESVDTVTGCPQYDGQQMGVSAGLYINFYEIVGCPSS